ncbi:sensor histidine kinase [Streptomyces sp. NPDC058614]|uniref:sensor histidine kinase n=1 Tax=Streptomyces sp. NPDC058614 TaxID=3346557 RepID=UPI00364CCB88
MDSATQSRAIRIAVLPAALMAALASAVVIFVLLAQDGAADAATWGVLAGGAVLGCSVLVGGALVARTEARRVPQQYGALRRVVSVCQANLQEVLDRLERGERVEPAPFTHQAPPRGDALGQLAYEISVSMWQAQAAVAQTTQLSRGPSPDSEEKVEVFVNLARRLQSLVHREINILDELENEVEDPELLKGLFQVDHLATRIRRHAENVALLGGSVSRRQWTRPVTLTEVLRSSIAEVEHYSRVKLVPPIEGTLRGHAVADVIHLLAELVENATAFSDPTSQVLLRAQRVTAGLAVEVEDRGLGIPLEEQARVNALLAEPDRIDISKLLTDGRIGLYVVSALARRHGIAVRLQTNIYGGIQAVLIIPRGLIGDEPPAAPVQVPEARHSAVQAPTATHSVTPPPPSAQPLPPAQPVPTSMPVSQQHARPSEPTRPGGHVLSHDPDPRDGRPVLPQRRAQENLVPELRDGPVTGRSGDGDGEEAAHNPDLMAAFRRGISLAEDAPDESSADNSR